MLNDAVENEYDVSTWTVEEIATDLICYATDCEGATVEQLTPFIQTWKDSNDDTALFGAIEGVQRTYAVRTPR